MTPGPLIKAGRRSGKGASGKTRWDTDALGVEWHVLDDGELHLQVKVSQEMSSESPQLPPWSTALGKNRGLLFSEK